MATSDLLIYLLKASLILTCFYGFYFFILRKSNQHAWNRTYLLITLLLSIAVPFLKIPETLEIKPILETPVLSFEEAIQQPLSESIPQNSPSISPDSAAAPFRIRWDFLPWIYVGIVAIFLMRFLFHLYLLQRLKNQPPFSTTPEYKLHKIKQTRPFSFLKNIFIPDQLFRTDLIEKIIAHERAHVRYFHSIDRLLMDFYVSLFWFNPFTYWYRKALIEVHEYQADQAVIEAFEDPVSYQEALFSQLVSTHRSELVSHFNFSLIKKRIVMINKNQTKSPLGWHLLALPIFAIVIFAFSSRLTNKHLEVIEGDITVMMQSDLGLVQIRNTIPAILPLEQSRMNRISSGYGMRLDPISKERKMHTGVDFAAPVGTEVYATADGSVVELDEAPTTYGKYMVLDHGNYLTRYHHLSEFAVRRGDKILQGDLIGYVGNSGRSTAPHLHYEVFKYGERVNPIRFLGKEFSKDGAEIPSIFPLRVQDSVQVLSMFGMRLDPILKVRRPHRGIDFKAPLGTPVIATSDGTVELAVSENLISGYGNQVIVDHGGGYRTRYAHLSEVNVVQGQKVWKGEQIGTLGNTGKSVGPHLHYEVLEEGKPVDPKNYLENFSRRVKMVDYEDD